MGASSARTAIPVLWELVWAWATASDEDEPRISAASVFIKLRGCARPIGTNLRPLPPGCALSRQQTPSPHPHHHHHHQQPSTKMDNQVVFTDEMIAHWRQILQEDPDGPQVEADLDNLLAMDRQLAEVSTSHTSMFQHQATDFFTQMAQRHEEQREHAYPIGPLLPAAEGEIDGPMGMAPPVPPPAQQQPNIQLAAAQPPIPQQSAVQQPAVQQPGPANGSCPIQGCNALAGDVRMDHLRDHLAEVHGYERAAHEYTTAERHLKRKTVAVLKLLHARDARKLAWKKARVRAAEEAARQRDQSYASHHGLSLTMQHSIEEARTSKKAALVGKLQAVRNEMGQKGGLYSQSGAGEGSWDEVYEDLVSALQLGQDDQIAVFTRARQYLGELRASMGDDMNDVVPPERVELTHELVLKPGASLPPK